MTFYYWNNLRYLVHGCQNMHNRVGLRTYSTVHLLSAWQPFLYKPWQEAPILGTPTKTFQLVIGEIPNISSIMGGLQWCTMALHNRNTLYCFGFHAWQPPIPANIYLNQLYLLEYEIISWPSMHLDSLQCIQSRLYWYRDSLFYISCTELMSIHYR